MNRIKVWPWEEPVGCILVCMLDIDYEFENQPIYHSVPVYVEIITNQFIVHYCLRDHRLVIGGKTIDELQVNVNDAILSFFKGKNDKNT